MELEGLRQAPLNTTLMGVVRGVFDYYGIAISDPMLFGAGGHGFAMNVHKQLCPSGPYCWNREPVRRLLGNLGVRMDLLGAYWDSSTFEDRERIEEVVRGYLDRGQPCSLLNMENQLVTGYDATAFYTAQPWPHMDFPPRTLSFGSWKELGQEIHLEFYAFERTEPVAREVAVHEGLRYAARSFRNPEAQTGVGYGFGPDGYSNWIEAVRNGFGDTHGNWWNGTVWAECRRNASAFLKEISPILRDRELGESLSGTYCTISRLLEAVSEKERPKDDKIQKLTSAKEAEETAVSRLESYLESVKP
jgi:hypothetical protein